MLHLVKCEEEERADRQDKDRCVDGRDARKHWSTWLIDDWRKLTFGAVITDPNDPKFDLEAFLTQVQKDSP